MPPVRVPVPRTHAVASVATGSWIARMSFDVSAAIAYASFGDWWRPFTLGVGPAGAYAQGRSDPDLSAIRTRCRELLLEGRSR